MVSRGVTIKITGRLVDAMAGLDEQSGRLVELYLRGLSMAEIAAAFGEPEEAVRESVLAVVLRMRERLAA
jgi:DNA-directed RNA polymerase specialized sigma24 family protein